MCLSHARYRRKYLEVDKVITGKTVTVFSQNVSLSLVYRACIHILINVIFRAEGALSSSCYIPIVDFCSVRILRRLYRAPLVTR